MSDIQLAIFLAALALLGFYVWSAREQDSRPAADPAPASDRAFGALRWFAYSLCANLTLSIPWLAQPPFSVDDGHSMGTWLAAFLGPWLRWLGLTQLLFTVPLWRRQSGQGRQALGLAWLVTAGMCGLAWAVRLAQAKTLVLQAAGSLLALACLISWCHAFRKFRNLLMTPERG